MSIASVLELAPGIWRPAPPASAAAIESLRASVPFELPDLYLQFLATTNGGEGDLGVEPGWLVPWAAEDVCARNEDYKVAEFLPGLFGLGSIGGGELLAFDIRGEKPWPIVSVPFIPMQLEEATQIASSFEALSAFIGVPCHAAA